MSAQISLVELSALRGDLREKVRAHCPTPHGTVVWRPERHYKALDANETSLVAHTPFTRAELDEITASRVTFDGDSDECVAGREAEKLMQNAISSWGIGVQRKHLYTPKYITEMQDNALASANRRWFRVVTKCLEARRERANGGDVSSILDDLAEDMQALRDMAER